MQGFVPDWQTWPTLALPLAIPLTAHVTEVSAAFVTIGVNDMRCPTESVAWGGETLTPMLLVMVTDAEATAPGAGVTVAWIVTGSAWGRSIGAL